MSCHSTKTNFCKFINFSIVKALGQFKIISGQCLLSNWHFVKADKDRRFLLALYKSIIRHVILYGAKAWMWLKSHTAALGIFERKFQRKICGQACVSYISVSKLRKRCITSLTTLTWLCWIGARITKRWRKVRYICTLEGPNDEYCFILEET